MNIFLSIKKTKQNKKDKGLFDKWTEHNQKSLFFAQVTSFKFFKYTINRMDALH